MLTGMSVGGGVWTMGLWQEVGVRVRSRIRVGVTWGRDQTIYIVDNRGFSLIFAARAYLFSCTIRMCV
ncbi:hypothetical protein HZH66_007478 [Vespula vulgaris]|uniref:Uncharacterized protein n=1 Tax=Vespula vulgaris TaxID=7454 RepID=A0A834K3K2_VESVU|nr:hypothetical protein HZH66_007478 [Vespula vulgaris]